MKKDTSEHDSSERSTKFSLPIIQNESNQENNNKSSFLKSLNHKDLFSPNSNEIVETWLLVHPESNKRVQFARDVNNQNRRTQNLSFYSTDSLPDINEHIQHLDLTSINSNELEKINEDESPRHHATYLRSISEAKLYRSYNKKTLPLSNSTVPALSHSHHSSNLPPMNHHHLPPSIESSSSITSTSTIKDRSSSFISNTSITKDRLSNLTSLELNSSLSETDRKIFDDIRQQVPDEFEQLLPTLFKLGVVLWPKKFFDNNQQLTFKELKQRQHLMIIIEKDQQDSQQQLYLQRLYGSTLPPDNILHKRHLLRDNLSYEGQLSLLSAYRDEIETELTKKIPHWKIIPMRILRTSFIAETNRSSIISNTFQVKQKFLQLLSSQKLKTTDLNIYQLTNDDLFSLTLPDKIDNQWKKKFLGKIIEQSMNILDQIRNFPQISIENQNEDYDLKRNDIVRMFKRWVYLWSTLYTDEKYFR